MIVCGWCAEPTAADCCRQCLRDPVLPWTQRGRQPPRFDPGERRRKSLTDAMRMVRSQGHEPTVERLAEVLDVSPRTVRRWQGDVRPVASYRPSPKVRM